jgi:pimeloyl-ACP methyl ester carboxylesterase
MLPLLLAPLLCSQVLEVQDEAVSIEVEGKILNGSLTRGGKVDGYKHRAALIISGSGPTDRDGNSLPFMKNDSLKLLAHAISRNGISTLRVDKRGVAASKSAGLKEEDLRFTTYVDDITQWINFLNKQGYKEVILIGHSEGALVATMAAKHNSVVGLVSLAGAGRSAPDILKGQLKVNLPEAFVPQAFQIIDQLSQGKEVKEVPMMFQTLFRPSVQPYLISWFKLDPAKKLAKLEIPVLIIQGTTDLQIQEKDAKLLHEAAKNSKLHLMKGMNHVLKKADGDKTKQLPSYLKPNFPLFEGLSKTVCEFLENPKK